jgi:phosphatidylethanolamine/phosphatidyl-N-methylethanolamine N-methyltransferase
MIHRDDVNRGLRKKSERFGDAAQFFRTWAEKPLQLGSVTPSSRYLSRAIARHIDPRSDGPVIEIGAGTGPVTEALLHRGVAEKRLVLIEYSADFCKLLRRRFPAATVVQGDAYSLVKTLDGTVEAKAAGVVCGLPLFTKPEAMRLDLLRQAFSLMKQDAPFVQFTYAVVSPMPLRNAFFEARRSPRVWRNMPPACVWVYRQPLKN